MLLLLALPIVLTGCSETVEQQKNADKTPTETSSVEMKIKCKEHGSENYQDMFFDDGSIEFEFFYSPSLDTCVLQREEFGPGAAYAIMLYDLFTKEMMLHYSTSNDPVKCTMAQALDHEVNCVASLEDFREMKRTILGI